MKMEPIFRPVALLGYSQSVEFFEKAQAGLGLRFESTLQSVLDEAVDNPKRYPMVDGDIREAPIPNFPFCIYYRVRNQRFVVLAVYHQFRDPSGWKARA